MAPRRISLPMDGTCSASPFGICCQQWQVGILTPLFRAQQGRERQLEEAVLAVSQLKCSLSLSFAFLPTFSAEGPACFLAAFYLLSSKACFLLVLPTPSVPSPVSSWHFVELSSQAENRNVHTSHADFVTSGAKWRCRS